jgi:paraquat-inducible protein A
MAAPAPATDIAVPACSALAAGLWRCHGCAAVCVPPPEAIAQRRARCPRCDAVVHPRLPDSIARSWAFLLAGTALYLPANLLPVTVTSSIGGRQSDTIFSGIVYFWKDGQYGLAILVFIASIAVPMAKLLLLSLLLISLQRHDRRWAVRRLKVWRALEFIGRWSMLDIFAIAILAALVQVESLAELRPGPGAMAFGAVVVLTMLSTHNFDPRLLFDKPEGERAPMPQTLADSPETPLECP